ncbi:MAG TPA: hypothetical protein IAC03_00585 [Candidatus Coprenecus pullistercoris]|nr:hypothetical protein [Candidatus Coprenecus pullistercoris]
MKRTVTVLSFIAAVIGCVSERDASDVVLLVDQSAYAVTEGNNVRFNLETWTVHEKMDRVDISSYDSENGRVDLQSIPLNVRHYAGEYLYQTPDIDADTLFVELSFTAYDNAGNVGKRNAYISVVNKDSMLDEAAVSVLMYSPDSGRPDGFSLRTLQPLYVSASRDEDVDIYVPQRQDSDVLSDEWRSKSGLKFVKMTGVDYATMTRDRLWALYANAVKSDVVTGIETGDVILVGTDISAAGAVLVTGVFDEPGTDADRYMFNIKLI